MSSHWGSLLLFQVILEVKLYLVLHTMFFNSQVHLEHFSSSFLKLTSLCPRFSWKAFSQGSIGGLFYVNFMIDQFSYLNITSIGRNLIQDENDCGYACLEIPSCFSYNVAAFPDVNNKRLCELLPSDKHNNSDKFNASKEFHHFFIPVSQTSKWWKVFHSITLSLPNVAKCEKNFQISFCKMLKIRIAPCESKGREVSFEWWLHRILSAGYKTPSFPLAVREF